MNRHHTPRRGLKNALRSLLLLGLFTGITASAGAQNNQRPALNTADMNAVLNKCISVSGIEKIHPGVSSTFSVLQGPAAFPEGLSLQARGHSVAILGHKDARPDAYFQFRDIQSAGQTVAVVMNYFYHDGNRKMRLVGVNLQLKKSGAAWTIVKSEIKKLI